MLIHSATITGSVQFNNTDVSGITNVAGFATTSSVNTLVTATGSYATTSSVNDLQSKTGSYALTSSFNAYTASNDTTNTAQNTRLSTIESVTGSYATTGSNQFNGNQSISGSIVSNGTITAQTLVVQTVTSSIEFVTGSTRNGSIAGNTHQFTGSVLVSGSITSNGLIFNTNNTVFDTAGSITKHSVVGLVVRGTSGSVFDYSLYSAGGTALITNPTNTNTINFNSGQVYFNGGNVGIGTSSPSSILHVNGGALPMTVASTNATELYCEYRYNTTSVIGYIGNGTGIASGASGDFGMRAQNNLIFTSGGGTERLRINSNGILIQNGVGRRCFSGNIAGNQSVTVTVNCVNESSFKITCMMNHYGLFNNYGCAKMSFYANGPSSDESIISNVTSGNGGSWSIARISNTSFSITKNAGSYSGPGEYFIEVIGATLT